MNLPLSIFSGNRKEGHVQGIVVDVKNSVVYYSFTTVLLKTDFEGKPLASVENLVGHLGCIAFDEEKNRIYGSLEMKHDVIGNNIVARSGKALADEDAFYLVSFDLSKMDRMEMDAEKNDVMKAVYLADVVRDYSETDETCGLLHRFGCSGIDGISLGPVFGADPDSEKKIMIAYGIYSDVERGDNDHQVILQLSPSVIDEYGKSLDQARPHHLGPDKAEERYFFHTGNTRYGIQNLEYDSHTRYWFAAVYPGEKAENPNYRHFAIDGSVPPKKAALQGRGGEEGLLLTPAPFSKGSHFRWGATGMFSLGNGNFYISKSGKTEDGLRFTNVKLTRFDKENPDWFSFFEE